MSDQKLLYSSFWLNAWRDKRIRIWRWGIIIIFFCALFADFLANEKPLYIVEQGKSDSPALRAMLSKVGLAQWTLEDIARDWKTNSDSAWYAPIPYSPLTTDLNNANFRGPFEKQAVSSNRFRHWLGTDHLGRDVLSGLIHGSRVALLVGLLSMLLAAAIGIPLGAAAGYLGDDRWRVRISALLIWLFGLILLSYFIVLYVTSIGAAKPFALYSIIGTALILGPFIWIERKIFKTVGRVRVPVDIIVLRSIEVLRSIPAFFLLFALLGMIQTPRLIYVIFLIAFLAAPSLIRFVRAEALKLRDQTYLQSARVLGLNHRAIIWRHVIPNAIGPALITLAFGMGSAVLIESGLSFLGIGIPAELMTWGKMLNSARAQFSAWWMALLPGLAIFITIAVFNRMGDYLESRISGRD